jgi:hypothetical protein
MSVNSFSVGIWPASDSLLAFTNTITRIVTSCPFLYALVERGTLKSTRAGAPGFTPARIGDYWLTMGNRGAKAGYGSADPRPDGLKQISTDGGSRCRAPNGQALFYAAPDGELMAVSPGFTF